MTTSTETVALDFVPAFDPNREHGTVFGDHEHGACYEQDGFLFDGSKSFLAGAMTPDILERYRKEAGKRRVLDRVKSMLADEMPDLSPEDIDGLAFKATGNGQMTSADVDLKAWAEGSVKYPFFLVTAACRDRFNQGPVNKQQVMELLAENNVIAPRGGFVSTPNG